MVKDQKRVMNALAALHRAKPDGAPYSVHEIAIVSGPTLWDKEDNVRHWLNDMATDHMVEETGGRYELTSGGKAMWTLGVAVYDEGNDK